MKEIANKGEKIMMHLKNSISHAIIEMIFFSIYIYFIFSINDMNEEKNGGFW